MAKKKKVKRNSANRQGKDSNVPKILIVYGDTLLVRDFVLNELKQEFKLVVQTISGTRRRNANNFKLHIVEGSQCHVAYNNKNPDFSDFEWKKQQTFFFCSFIF